jgi:hypothetical protein
VYFWRYRWFAHLRLPKCQKQLSRDVFCFSAWTMSEKVLRPHLIMAYPVPSAWRLSEDSKILPLWKPKLAGKSPFLLKLAGNLDSCKKHELSSSIFRKKWSTRGYLSTPPLRFQGRWTRDPPRLIKLWSHRCADDAGDRAESCQHTCDTGWTRGGWQIWVNRTNLPE